MVGRAVSTPVRATPGPFRPGQARAEAFSLVAAAVDDATDFVGVSCPGARVGPSHPPSHPPAVRARRVEDRVARASGDGPARPACHVSRFGHPGRYAASRTMSGDPR
jgi:hypothetical protein